MANITELLCNESYFEVLDQNQKHWYLTDCFQSLVIFSPIYTLLAVISSLLIGWTSGLDPLFNGSHVWLKRLLKIKSIIVLIILSFVSIDSIVTTIAFKQINVYYISKSFQIIALILHLIYLVLKLRRNHLSHNSQTYIAINITVVLIIASKVNQIYTLIAKQNPVLYQLVCAIVVLILWSTYLSLNILIAIKFKSYEDESNEQIDVSFDDFHSIDSQLSNEENSNIISKLLFLWVKPLMTRGIQKKINSSNDLFKIPDKISAENVYQKFDSVFDYNPIIAITSDETNPKSNSLLKALLRCYGWEVLLVGCLKFSSDILSFSGPLLLNKVILYLESDDHNSKDGFYYGLGMFGSTLLSSIFISLFNFYINNVSLKIRNSIITTIYKKIFSIRSNTLNQCFSTGEILNFASTDTDRVVNFCPSLLQFISLPIQLSFALYLLYQQLGLAFLSGVVFAIILIPINRWICNKIGDLSTKMMDWKDKRIKLMTEILNGIRVIKMHSWEDLFQTRINRLREEEVKYLKRRKYLDAFCVYFWATTPVLISSLVFGTFVLLNGQLTASVVFTSLALLGMLIMPLNAFPWVLNGLMESWVSIKRLQKLFDLYPLEVDKHYNHMITETDNKIEAIGVSFTSTQTNGAINRDITYRFVLGPIDLILTPNMFVGVIGPVGSGKTSLINAFLAEMQRISGRLGISRSDVQSGIGVVTQEPWIQNTTVMENILFGRPFDAERYHSVLDSCALIDDLNTFPEGDLTVIGDRGVTLSGGQKTRISLARAVYQDFDVYLIDDPFASVDAHVAQHIYNKCISGLLSTKTKILCTHSHKFLLMADLILRLDSGQIMASGSPQEMLRIKDNSKEKDENSVEDSALIEENDNLEAKVREEEREEGVVKLDVYLYYIKSVGICLSALILVSILLMQISKSASDCWLAFWSSKSRLDSKSSVNYLIIFVSIAAINSVLTLLRSFIFAYGGVVAALRLHNSLFQRVIRAPVLFFDLTPFGRIINRFSSDLFNIDDALPFTLNIFLSQFYSLLSSVLITVYGLPYMSFLIIPLSIPYYFIQRYYRWTSRELRRLCAVSLSPIYAQLDETLQGLVTIRAFAKTERLFVDLCQKLNLYTQTQYASAASQQWLNLRLQLLGVVVSTGVVMIAVGLHYWSEQTIDAGLVGLALVYSLSVTTLLNGAVQSFAQTEMDMVSVERIMQYINDIQSEQSIDCEDHIVMGSEHWPNKGIIRFDNVSMRYRSDMRLALDCLSLSTKSFEKIGIVGRTGSGKSSLFQVLFRLVDIEEGKIFIDGTDISTISLRKLRSSLFIIPQEPFLFSGTIRDNLDPKSQYMDTEIWHSLRECHLESLILSLGGLSANISERGRDLSCGQRQLLCLVRALLSKTKVLCIDEATASVDSNTDKLIHKTIRHVFTSATVMFVAHKIESVLDCDRIIVMDNSRIAEIGAPDALLHNSNSMFYSLCNQ